VPVVGTTPPPLTSPFLLASAAEKAPASTPRSSCLPIDGLRGVEGLSFSQSSSQLLARTAMSLPAGSVAWSSRHLKQGRKGASVFSRDGRNSAADVARCYGCRFKDACSIPGITACLRSHAPSLGCCVRDRRHPLPAAHLERAQAAVPSCREVHGCTTPSCGLQEGEAPTFSPGWSGIANAAVLDLSLANANSTVGC